MVQFGFIDASEMGVESEKDLKWGEQWDGVMVRLANYCIENNIPISPKLELVSIGVSLVMLLGVPIAGKVMDMNGKKKEKKKPEESHTLEKALQETPETKTGATP